MLRIGVLASHEGTTLQSLIDACVQGRINGRVVVVISNNSGSGALRRAAAAGIDTFHVSSVTHPSSDALDDAIGDALRRARADVMFLAGYMKRLGSRTLAAFAGLRIVPIGLSHARRAIVLSCDPDVRR